MPPFKPEPKILWTGDVLTVGGRVPCRVKDAHWPIMTAASRRMK